MLSIIIPVFNEVRTLREVISRVRTTSVEHEIIIVDDASTDGTSEILRELSATPYIRIFSHEINQGKGGALRTGFTAARGDIVIVQDADLEYDPSDYPALIGPIISGLADIVYGSRFLNRSSIAIPTVTYCANRFITWLFNRIMGSSFTDVETCYKAIRSDALRQVIPQLKENRFGIEIELTARLLKLSRLRFREVPIRYQARCLADGKKIGFTDGVRALWCIFHYR